MGKRTDQASQQNATDSLKSDEETLTTNRAATAIPALIGAARTTARWMTPIYGQRVVKVPASGGGKKG